MPGLSSRGIFLSYRHADAAPHAVTLRSRLKERIPDAHVFMDLVSIEPGLEFAEVIRDAIDSCAVLVALIGLKWATLADEEGYRRLDKPDDYVRLEIQAALERGVRVIPVLVDGAGPLQQRQLPDELQRLARLQALELSYRRYDYDADELLNLIQRVLAAVPDAGAVDQSPPAADPEPAPNDRVRAARLVDRAERIADSITDEHAKAEALADIAGMLAATDPDRAESIARSITDKNMRAKALAILARMVAATDPDRAERMARSITDKRTKEAAVAILAEKLAATDPDRAESIAESIADKNMKAMALADIARALAATDPDRAERMAQSIPNEYRRAKALAAIARALAATDPDRAERITQSIPNEYTKAKALADLAWVLEDDRYRDSRVIPSFTYKTLKAGVLADIARALAPTSPDRAESIALSITDKNTKAKALADIARALAATDRDSAARLSADAERIAQSITDGYTKAGVLADIAGKLATTDPGRAARLVADAERIAQSITDKNRIALLLTSSTSMSLKAAAAQGGVKLPKARALAILAGKVGATDLDRAEHIAQSITDKDMKAEALAAIAWMVAATDLDRAERIADSITDRRAKAEALADIAEMVAATDPDRAESIADSITDKRWMVRALVMIAES